MRWPSDDQEDFASPDAPNALCSNRTRLSMLAYTRTGTRSSGDGSLVRFSIPVAHDVGRHEDVGEVGNLVGTDRHVRSHDVLPHVHGSFRPGYGCDVQWLRQEPRERELTGSTAFL